MVAYFRAPGGIYRILKRTVEGIIEDDCPGLAAELAYYFFLALFPALIFGIALLGFLHVQGAVEPMLKRLSTVAPGEVVAIIGRQLREITSRGSGTLLSLGLLGAILSSSAAVSAITNTLNHVYGIRESRPWWKVKLISILLTIGLVFLLLLAMALVLFGPAAANWVDGTFHLGSAVTTLWNVFRWVGAFFLAVVAIDLVYYFGPDAETEWVWFTPGSLLATLLWILGSLGFRIYLAYFGNYNATYGALGGVIVLLLWLYVSGLSILIGAELDSKVDEAVMARHNMPQWQGGVRPRIGPALEHY